MSAPGDTRPDVQAGSTVRPDRLGAALRLGLLTVLAALIALTLVLVLAPAQAALPGLPDPGRLTRWGLPVVQSVRDLAAVLSVGLLVTALFCLSPGPDENGRTLAGTRQRLVDVAGRALLVWAAASLALLALAWSDAAGAGLLEPGAWERIRFFAAEYDLGHYLLSTTALAGVAGLLAMVARSARTGFTALALTVLALWPMALVAHGTGGSRHDLAVNVQFVHLLAVAVWGGGVVALALVASRDRDALAAALPRFSRLAGLCLAALALAGLVGGALRVGGLDALGTTYGLLLGLKVVAALGIAGLGWIQRQHLLRRDVVPVGRLLWTETAVLALTVGIAVALGRTPPPISVPQRISTGVDLIGYELPATLDAGDWFTAWRIDTFWAAASLLAVGGYLLGVARLRRRGDAWSVLRTLSWVAGWALLVWATCGAPGVYGQFMFSMHMIQHMAIATTIPVLLVVGAPVTLALRAVPARPDGSMGPREWVNSLVRSPYAAFFGHPLVASAIFVASLFGFYFTNFFTLAVSTHTGHLLMSFHFLLSGYLFANVLIGADPTPHRPSHPVRVLLVMVVFAVHSFFSVALMSTSTILGRTWFERFDPGYGHTLAEDQHLGAALGWALGEFPLLMLGAGLLVMWVKADAAERRRFDRHERRTGESALAEYNARLAAMHAADRPRTSASASESASPASPSGSRTDHPAPAASAAVTPAPEEN